MILDRIWKKLDASSVFWSWVFNFFRLASGVLLLPLLLDKLTERDLGMHYFILSLVMLVPILDTAFSFNLSRFVGYAMGGAREIIPLGMSSERGSGRPNFRLAWELLLATRALFFRVSLLAVGLLTVIGFFAIRSKVPGTSNVELTWLAAGLAVIGAGVEIYSSWWNSYLRGLNEVRGAARIAALSYAFRLLLSCLLLLLGAGLASVPAAGIVASIGQRWFSRRGCLQILPEVERPSEAIPVAHLLATLWPNSWRAGLQHLSRYLAIVGATTLCLHVLGLEYSARFGLSWQIGAMIQGIASVWTAVVWPRISQLRIQSRLDEIRHLLRPRIWFQNISFLILGIPLVMAGQVVLDFLGSDKQLLPSPWLMLFVVNLFFEMNFSAWATLLETENWVPSLWATVTGNLAGLLLAVVLMNETEMGVGALVVGPLCSGVLFNYWYWPIAGARNLHTTWVRFTFLGER